MNLSNSRQQQKQGSNPRISYDWIAFSLLMIAVAIAVIYLFSSAGAHLRNTLTGVLALSTDQAMWYLTRAAGMIAYLLLWFSTVWGLLIPSKLFAETLSPDFTFDFHKFISLLSLGFLGLHIVVLTADRYMPYSIAQILVPFISPYRPVWVGVGVVAFYISILVTITFYLRKQIGTRAFRVIHYTSLIAYIGAVAHSLLSGTDSSLPVVLLMYIGTTAVVVFLTVYWLVRAWLSRPQKLPQGETLPSHRSAIPDRLKNN